MADSEYDSCDSEGNLAHSYCSSSTLNSKPTGLIFSNSADKSKQQKQKPQKISGTAKVLKVTSKFAYISSDRYGSIFVLPKSAAHHFHEPNAFINLQKILRVDEHVHFVAVSQINPQNSCIWLAMKVTKSTSGFMSHEFLEDEASSSVDPFEFDVIKDVRGVILDVHDKYGFVMAEKYGRIYLPLAASFIGPPQSDGGSEVQKLGNSFCQNDVIVFDAQKQPEKNGCRYTVFRIKAIVELGDLPIGSPTIPVLNDQDTNSNSDAVSVISNGSSSQQTCVFFGGQLRSGEISKLFASFGFIKSFALGSVYFTLSNYAGLATLPAQRQESGSLALPPVPAELTLPASLFDVFSLGDRVQFIVSPQPEKNGCKWRGMRVQKLPPGYFGTTENFDDFATYLRINAANGEANPEQTRNSVANGAFGDSVDQSVSVLVSSTTQTDSLSTPLISDAEKNDAQPVTPKSDKQTQTLPSPEQMLLNAVKRDSQLVRDLTARFPDLMRYVFKNI